MGNREIKQSNKTKEEVYGFSLGLITPPRACEPVLEVETDLADSGAQSGSVSSSRCNGQFFPQSVFSPGKE